MAQSKKKLIDRIDALAATLDSPVATEGLDVGALTAILENLESAVEAQEKADAEAQEKADAEAQEKADAEAQEKADAEDAENPPYYMIEGRSLTTKRGILSNGDEVTADDFYCGQVDLDRHIAGGYIGQG